MNSKNTLTVSLIGVSWALIGLGYQSVVIRYVPEGGPLLAEGLGLFLAGAVTGSLFLRALDALDHPLGRMLLTMGYLMFSPLGIMAGLVAPGSLEPISGGSWVPFFLGAPVLIVISATLAVLVGMGFTGGLAMAVQKLNVRVEASG